VPQTTSTSILGQATLVLADRHCARVLVVAHSLGTPIAMDALLQFGRHNRARTDNSMSNPSAAIAARDHRLDSRVRRRLTTAFSAQ
jgi:esterase/lipase superfamily enzyme